MAGSPRRTRVLGVSIGIAATEVAMHPQTLREYERQGLVSPHRTEGGARRYRDAELARLRRIQQLVADGVGISGMRRILELEELLAGALRRSDELESRLRRHEHVEPACPSTRSLVVRSMSLELVHVPRSRRSPRWRNPG